MTASARDLDLRQHHGIETPEHVDVQFELAGVGSRLAAGLLDLLLLVLGLLALWIGGGAIIGSVSSASEMRGWLNAGMIILTFCFLWGYFTLFEALNGGRTPGKQALGIRVVMDTGRSITPSAAVVRNLVRFIDCYFPVPFAPALISMFLHPSNKRPGDMAAGTIVVRDHPTDWSLGASLPTEETVAEPLEAGPPELSEEEFRLLDRFLGRINDLAPEVQVRITTDLVRRFEPRIPRRNADLQGYLVCGLLVEQSKRRSRFAPRAKAGAAGRITVPAERFVQKKRAGWETFRTTALRMERSGVGALAPGEIPAFAAQYREVAADLARARTYQVDPRVIAYLERVVTAGHNALYRARGKQRTPLPHYILRDFPAAVVQSWRYVLLAFLLFSVPAVVGYVMIRERPELGEELMPGMVARAEAAAENLTEGRGYAETSKEDRPEMAAFIIQNNIGISFVAFVGGVTGGLLTAWLLYTNGLMLGLALGLFQNYDAARYLLTFILGHGILELTAIFISAGAGFRLAKAMIAPGDRTRKDALVLEGRIAARMIGTVVTLLAIAGTIEGLLSASAAAPIWKYGVSAATAVLLVLYFTNGYAYLNSAGPPPTAGSSSG